ncbi:MAG: hypothetical protein MUD14_29600, partial [Hydrococcus sp. Prado102]|nr:hypothetical protein [Hydrococcus sp. Prado102]
PPKQRRFIRLVVGKHPSPIQGRQGGRGDKEDNIDYCRGEWSFALQIKHFWFAVRSRHIAKMYLKALNNHPCYG